MIISTFSKTLHATIRLCSMVMLATLLSVELSATEPKAIVIGIDLTVERFDLARIRNGVMLYLHQNCDDGASIIAVAVTGKTFTQPVILTEIRLPTYRGIKGRARRLALEKFECELISALENNAKLGKEFLQRSRIADFFNLAANLFSERKVPPKRRLMILFSDMLEVDERRNWERDRELRAGDLRLQTVGGTVAIYGVQSRFYSNVKRWEDVYKIWIGLLTHAGVAVQVYSITYPR